MLQAMSTGMNRGMSTSQLMSCAPAVFANSAHGSRSDRYVFVPTLPIIQQLEGEGFAPFEASAAHVRDTARQGYQKHIVRMRHRDNATACEGGAAELVLISSHDGSGSVIMFTGWFEFLCTNGLVIGTKDDELRIRHKGSEEAVLHSVREAGQYMAERLTRVSARREEWLETKLTERQQFEFARDALRLRYKGDNVALEPDQVLMPRRATEMDNKRRFMPKRNKWHTFNVLQENLTRPNGLVGKDGRGRPRRQRNVTAIEQNTRINRELWLLAEKIAA